MMRTWAVAGVALVAFAVGANAQDQSVVVREKMRAELKAAGMKIRVPFETKVVTGAPYSAEVINESTQTLADGNRIVHRTTGRVYRDSQGRVRREDDREPGRVASVSITDPVAKVSYSLDPDGSIAWKTSTDAVSFVTISDGKAGQYTFTTSLDPADLERRRVIEAKIAQEAEQAKTAEEPTARVVVGTLAQKTKDVEWEEKVEHLPARQIDGVTAEGTRTTRTIAAGAIGNERPIVMVSEEWRSAELGVLLMTTTSDPRTGESTYRLSNISRSEPAPNLFEVPAGFTVTESGIRHEVLQLKREPR